ncbi:hypothetical protein J4573_18200 [Actinomadura barringtoniae]|uniref:Uncharacterized protein n=1 Tax=Actinomadura barringtoniae TaxID=1427535 RepID=A0A939PI97_9ACTN|nr:hypothetical protein [Actinomadura barringtoniae]MBO2449041.1 hypothetical protein [Actinomadura barringtoniae]
MILVLAAIIAVFLAGTVCGIFAMLVIGIHAEEHRTGSTSTAGSASRRLLRSETCDDLPARNKAGR